MKESGQTLKILHAGNVLKNQLQICSILHEKKRMTHGEAKGRASCPEGGIKDPEDSCESQRVILRP